MDKLNDSKTAKTKTSVSEESPYSNFTKGDHKYDALCMGKMNQAQHGNKLNNVATSGEEEIYGNEAAIRQAMEEEKCYEVFN